MDLSDLLIAMGTALKAKRPCNFMSKATGLNESTCMLYLKNAEKLRTSVGKFKVSKTV